MICIKVLYCLIILVAVGASPLEKPGLVQVDTEVSRNSFIHALASHNNTSPLRVRAPPIEVPFTIYIPDKDPNKVEREGMIRAAWLDALTLAAFTHATFNPNEDVFKRYFSIETVQFVYDIFGKIAHFSNPEHLPATNAQNLQKIMESNIIASGKFRQLIVSVGDHPVIAQPGQGCDLKTGSTPVAYTYQELRDVWPPNPTAYICLCEPAFRFPTLENIKKDTKATWTAGPGLNGLGDFDSGWMTSLGGILLHEFTHWKYLLQDVKDYAFVMLATPDHTIDDYDFEKWNQAFPNKHWPNPPMKGNGPNRAMQLNLNTQVPHMAILNADNYRGYAQSKWWAFVGGRAFGPPKGNADEFGDNLRATLPGP